MTSQDTGRTLIAGARTRLKGIRPGAIPRLLRNRLAQNAMALYSSQFASILVPLITIPYLTRILGPDMWGRVAFGQAAGIYVITIVEYGFNYSATRDVAQADGDSAPVAELVAGVVGARLALAMLCFGTAIVVATATSLFARYGTFIWLGMLWGVLVAIRPGWYFLGKERVRLVTAIDVLSKIAGTIAIFVIVRTLDDANLVLVMQALAAGASAFIATALLYHEVQFQLPTVKAIRSALRLGLGFFTLQSATSLYLSGNLMIVGLISPGAAVGFYAAAEKLERGIVSLTGPVTQVLYPRSSSLVVRAPAQAVRLARASTLAISAAVAAAATVLFITAPFVVPVVFGPGYQNSVPIIRVLALVLIPVGMSIPLTSQWLYPLGFESVMARMSIAAGIVHVVIAVVLVRLFSAIGAAYALLLTECLILSMIWFVLVRKGINPFSRGSRLGVGVSRDVSE